MSNRLQHATSPYLLQHAHNPVDWYPWGPEALERARREDRPIFLSIGYSACHWCHVMERESFEDEATAHLLNTFFVPVKVDREERPDLDELYMDAVQALTGRGGWPMSVWLTPDLRPFHGGTYFPPEGRHGMPGFRDLLRAIDDAWRNRREDLVQGSLRLAAHMEASAQVRPGPGLPGPDVFDRALLDLRTRFDARWGGFTPAPKFPAQHAVAYLLHRGGEADGRMARRTLDAMWEGGMYDHLGGGFARYSVDDRWLVPHFEKMLYDNAQLAQVYLAGYQALGEPRYARIAQETLDYLIRDMQDPEGGFHSAEDADSEGHEGRFYVWTPAEIEAVLGEEASEFCRAFGVTPEGNFEGRSVLHRYGAPTPSPEVEARLQAATLRLRTVRDQRPRPGRDDKVITGWNGLALSALSRSARILGREDHGAAALKLARFLQESLWVDGVLLRTWRRGHAHTPAFLEDHASLILGLVDLHEALGDPGHLALAVQIAEAMQARFEDPEEGGFFSATKTDDLLFRQKPLYDGVIPSGNTLAAEALLRLGRHLDRGDFIEAAHRALALGAPMMERAPAAVLALLRVLDLAMAPPETLVVAGEPEDTRTRALLQAGSTPWRPRLAFSVGTPHPDLPLRRDRPVGPEGPLAYLCEGFTCRAPLASPQDLAGCLEAGRKAE